MANDKTPKEAQPSGKIWLGDIIGGGRGGADFSESSVDEIAEAVARDIRDERIPAMTGEEAALMDKMMDQYLLCPEITEASEDILRQMADEGEKGGGKDTPIPEEECAELNAIVDQILSGSKSVNLGKLLRSLDQKHEKRAN